MATTNRESGDLDRQRKPLHRRSPAARDDDRLPPSRSSPSPTEPTTLAPSSDEIECAGASSSGSTLPSSTQRPRRVRRLGRSVCAELAPPRLATPPRRVQNADSTTPQEAPKHHREVACPSSSFRIQKNRQKRARQDSKNCRCAGQGAHRAVRYSRATRASAVRLADLLFTPFQNLAKLEI